MAQLKDLIVNGASRFIGTLYASTIYAPTTSGGGTYGPGSSGQVLLSNGTTAYWGTLAIANTSGTIPIDRGGTNATTAAAARANLAVMGAKAANNYYGMTDPSGADTVWIRTTTTGIIPYQSGNAGSGHCSLGTSTWYFSAAYIDTIYGSLSGNASSANKVNKKLTIGSYEFDGSAAVSIPVYNGATS